MEQVRVFGTLHRKIKKNGLSVVGASHGHPVFMPRSTLACKSSSREKSVPFRGLPG